MSAKAFLDTNILVYAYDKHEPDKQHRAQTIISEGIEQDGAVLSVQVLGEFYNVVTKKIKMPMSPGEAHDIITTLCILPVHEIDLAMVNRAIDTLIAYRISYWDALIIAAAERAGCRKIYSEDLNDGQDYHGINVCNPFN